MISALGTEQAAISATGTNWALNTGATNLNVGGYKHTVGSTTNLTTTLSAGIMQMYKITYTISSRTSGSVTINYGGVSTSGITSSASVDILAIATTVFSITPTSDFDGVISISVKQTSSATNQIKLPLPNSGTYNIWVDWGDGTYDNITSWNSIKTLHTYPATGIYTIRITGDRFSWQFANLVDRTKIKTVSSWGKLRLVSQSFQGCSNVTMSGITDVPDLTGVTSLSYTFLNCSKITTVGRMNEWNTSSVTIMVGTFNGSVLFNQCIGGWNVSNVTAFEGTFYDCLEFNNGDNSTPLNNWTLNTTSPVSLNYPFINCRKFNRYIGDWNTSKVFVMADLFNGCTIFNNGFDAGVETGNQLKWDTSSCTNMSKVFYQAPAFNSNLGTGTTPWDVSKVTTFQSMFQSATAFNNGDDSAPINNWNINTVSNVSMNSMFMGASIFNRDISNWNMTKVNHIGFMFNTATAFNQPVGNWERTGSTLGNVTNMRQTFRFTNFFNQDISNWNVNKVTDFGSMFNAAIAFNNGSNSNTNPVTSRTGIDGWDINTVSNVTMDSMFQSANAFNRPIDNWYMTKVTNINSMFRSSTFNHPLSNWERIGSTLGNVTDMGDMFASNIVFNQDLSAWNTGAVTTMLGMFNGATSFNNGLASGVSGTMPWDTGSCTNMSLMFYNAPSFNQDIGLFNVSKVVSFSNIFNRASNFNNGDDSTPINNWSINTVSGVNMSAMFAIASVFNRDISSWNMTKVFNTDYMFQNATTFNQPISNWERSGSTTSNINGMLLMFSGANVFNQPIDNWNVSSVVSMGFMFQNAIAFNQNIGAWNVSQVTNFTNFMSTKTPATFSSTNLDAIYNGWIVNGVKPNINISFGTAKYTAAGAIGRATLAAPPNGTGTWTITDGGQI